MAIGHLAIRSHKRHRGHTAAAALAYRHGARVWCTETSRVCDYRRRARAGLVRAQGIETARMTPLADNIETLARGIEGAEVRQRAQILRDVQVALPHELDEAARAALAREFALSLAERYGTVTSWAVHAPDAQGDQRNHHAHVVLPTRRLAEDGYFGQKLRQLDVLPQSRAEITAIRELWETLANGVLARAGEEARVDVGRARDGTPQATLGPAAAAIERRRHPERHGSIAEIVGDTPATRAGERLRASERWRETVAQRTWLDARGGDGTVRPRPRRRAEPRPEIEEIAQVPEARRRQRQQVEPRPDEEGAPTLPEARRRRRRRPEPRPEVEEPPVELLAVRRRRRRRRAEPHPTVEPRAAPQEARPRRRRRPELRPEIGWADPPETQRRRQRRRAEPVHAVVREAEEVVRQTQVRMEAERQAEREQEEWDAYDAAVRAHRYHLTVMRADDPHAAIQPVGPEQGFRPDERLDMEALIRELGQEDHSVMVEPWHPEVAYVALSGPRPHIEALADDGYRLIARLEDGDEETALLAAGHPAPEDDDNEWDVYRASRRLAEELGGQYSLATGPRHPVPGGLARDGSRVRLVEAAGVICQRATERLAAIWRRLTGRDPEPEDPAPSPPGLS